MTRLFYGIKKPKSDIQIESNLYAFLAYLMMSFSESPPLIYVSGEQNESIKRVCDYISHSFMKNLSLKELAEVAC